MEKKIFRIECFTNLHVGAGDVAVSIVDNCVQRDILTGYPTIHGSSLKGALRAHWSNLYSDEVEEIFGKESTEGKLKILSANLLAYPIVDVKDQCYNLKTTEGIKTEYENLTRGTFPNGFEIEEEQEFKQYIMELPVIARNHLENGMSKNLWYEEVVPRKTQFYFMVLSEYKNLLEQFSEKIVKSEYVQIGANSSIGYGYCKITQM